MGRLYKFDGGPAFARPLGHNGATHYEDRDTSNDQEGMSMLDYFAGQALVGILVPMTGKVGLKATVQMAYEVAAAMLEAREEAAKAEAARVAALFKEGN